MYLVQASMSGQLPFIPTTLPPGLYEMASDQTLPGSTVASHTTGNSGSFHHGMPGSFPQTSGSGIVQPQLTGKQLQPQYSGRPLQQQFTGPVAQNQTGSSARKAPAAPFSAFTAPQSQLAWDVTPTEKASADKHFDSLDTPKRGYIESDVAVPFMLQSNLPSADLASIWLALWIYSFPLTSHTMHRDLADLSNDGRLTRDGFAVAFHLIQGKLSGKEIPTTLPASLMPPSMRAVTAPATSPFQQPPSDSLNDLLWEDSPVTSQPQSAILQPQRTGHTQSPAISAPYTQGQSTFGMSQFSSKDEKFTVYCSIQ
jgi:epidermal growth factor receptor substrate 15